MLARLPLLDAMLPPFLSNLLTF
uniref:Uncharacterized protein n=1 Tax=Arundo donax TaxID=35708 RepID=A0A0A8Y161_ARUDO